MKLSDYKKDYDYVSSRASDVARQLSFAGIAIVWIFRSGTPEATEQIQIPAMLLWCIFFFSMALLADLFHYVVSACIWGHFHKIEERKVKEIDQDPDLDAPSYYVTPIRWLFRIKIILVLLAYGILSMVFFFRIKLS